MSLWLEYRRHGKGEHGKRPRKRQEKKPSGRLCRTRKSSESLPSEKKKDLSGKKNRKKRRMKKNCLNGKVVALPQNFMKPLGIIGEPKHLNRKMPWKW